MCQACPPCHSFCATWERASTAQAQEFQVRRAVMWASTLQRGTATEASLFSLTTCKFLGVLQFLWSWGRAVQLHVVNMQWKIHVRAAPCHNNLEMDEPDWTRQLPNAAHKLGVGHYQSCLWNQKVGDPSVLFQNKVRLSIFVHSKSPGQGGRIRA